MTPPAARRGAVGLLLLAAACGGGAPPAVQPTPLRIDNVSPTVLAIEAAVVAQVRSAVGRPYRLGGRDSTGFDCSGLIQSAYAAHGYALPRISRDQARAGRSVPLDLKALRPGDILAFAGSGIVVSHVGLYVGNGRFIHSASRGVRESRLDAADPDGRWYVQRWVGARRILPTWPSEPADSTD